MHWELLIPIIAFAVWILSTLLRKKENDFSVRRPAPYAEPQRQGEPRPQRTQSEVDQFLEEIERRRRRAAEQRGQPQTEPVPRPAPPPSPWETPRPQPPVVVPQRVPREQAEGLLEVEPVEEPPPVRRTAGPPRLPEFVPVVIPVAAVASLPLETPPPQLTRVTRKPRSPTLAKVSAMLRTPQALRTAVLLHEVLGPPRCRRHGHNW